MLRLKWSLVLLLACFLAAAAHEEPQDLANANQVVLTELPAALVPSSPEADDAPTPHVEPSPEVLIPEASAVDVPVEAHTDPNIDTDHEAEVIVAPVLEEAPIVAVPHEIYQEDPKEELSTTTVILPDLIELPIHDIQVGGQSDPSPAPLNQPEFPNVVLEAPVPVDIIAEEVQVVPETVAEVQEVAVPIQLIYPSEDHERLLINETSLAFLSSLNKSVAIVAVCGPLHSGKSFLMNQLLNRTSGFALGPTTEPKTRGLWMWNAPLELDSHYVVFLDTEGLFASNISEAYDAKIFSISTLVSSYLIYNSVKFIDQSAIDYIELLARRAQLFGIKAEISKGEPLVEAEALDSFVSLPKLLWLVQDFVQEMAHGETPQEWLNGLLASRKKSESSTSSLPALFEDIDCYTLFLPEYRREKLRHLDRVNMEDLLPEYKEDMKLLRDKVLKSAAVKHRGHAALTGGGAAALLQTLVMAANRGAFPEVPSIWKSFLTVQTQQALKDATDFYDSSMAAQCATHGPFNHHELASLHSQTVNDTRLLFSRLTFGLKDLEAENIDQLFSNMAKLFLGFEHGNSGNLSRLCQDTYKRLRDDFKVNLWHIDLPMKKSLLSHQLQGLHESHLDQFRKQLSRFQEEEAFKTYITELKSNMKGDMSGVELENVELLQELIANASAEAIVKCSQYLASQDTQELGAGITVLIKHKQAALGIANQFFEEKASFALEDLPTAPAARKALDSDLQAVLTRYEVQNSDRVDKRAQKVTVALAREMSQHMEEIRLPQTRTIIEGRAKVVQEQYLEKFDATLTDVAMMEPTKAAREKLLAAAADDLTEILRRNNVKYDRIISDSLPTLKSSVAPIIAEYWWPPAAKEYALKAINATLKDELIENEELIADLANRFIETNLKEELHHVWVKLGLTAGLSLTIAAAAIVGLCCRKTK